MIAGEPCKVSRDICGVPGPHSHCDCGWGIPIGAGFCRICLSELARGAVMRSVRALPPAPQVAAAPLELPSGHGSWQTTPTCRYGHDMTPENTYWIKGFNNRMYRCCRECRQITGRRANANYTRKHRALLAMRPPAKCPECGKEFQPKGGRQLFCCTQHRRQYVRRLRSAAKEKAA